jgi:hypothetical protein
VLKKPFCAKIARKFLGEGLEPKVAGLDTTVLSKGFDQNLQGGRDASSSGTKGP